MRLNELALAVQEAVRPKNCFSILLYGDTKTGKTRLAATLAKVPWLRNIYWFDLENGSDTLITMVKQGILTAEEAAKIVIYKIPDTKQLPMAMETMMKALTVKKDLMICDEHGKVGCAACATKDAKGNVIAFTGQPFNIAKLTEDDCIVIDSGSQLGDSILNYYFNKNGKEDGEKPDWDEYAPQGRDLGNVGLVIQSGTVNVVMITHVLAVEVVENAVKKTDAAGKTITVGTKRDMQYPLIGTSTMCRKFGKYFGHVIFMHKRANLHKAGSSSTYQPDVVTGSRLGWKIESEDNPDFSTLFAALGVAPKALAKPKS